MGSDYFFTSSELLADYANKGDEARFVLVAREPEDVVRAAPKVLTTLEELNSGGSLHGPVHPALRRPPPLPFLAR